MEGGTARLTERLAGSLGGEFSLSRQFQAELASWKPGDVSMLPPNPNHQVQSFPGGLHNSRARCSGSEYFMSVVPQELGCGHI